MRALIIRSMICATPITFCSGMCAQTDTITLSTNAGGLGTVIGFQLDNPGTSGVVFDDESTYIEFVGTYTPPGGSSSAFVLDLDPNEVYIDSPSTGFIILGQGSSSGAPNAALLAPGGTLAGTLTAFNPDPCTPDVNGDGAVSPADFSAWINAHNFNLPGCDQNGDDLCSPADFSAFISNYNTYGVGPCPAPSQADATVSGFQVSSGETEWHRIYYPTGPGGIDPPSLGPEPSDLALYRLSLLPNPSSPSESQLLGATGLHYAIVIKVEENASTSAMAPTTIAACVVSVDQSQTEFSRTTVELSMLSSDGDPNFITYVSPLDKPILLIDTQLTPTNYPSFSLLYAPTSGFGVISFLQ